MKLLKIVKITLFCSLLAFLATSQGHCANYDASQGLYSQVEEEFIPVTAEDAALLWALNQQEASGRKAVPPRFEEAFYRRYLKNNSLFAAAEDKYGQKAISSSYGPWQIMYSTAVEMGFRGDPRELSDPGTSLPYVLKYLRYLQSKFGNDVTKVVSAYNAGPGGVGTNPRYTNRVLGFLENAPSGWSVFGTLSQRS